MKFAEISDLGAASARSTTSPIAATVPVKLFGILFLVILVGFLIWYMIMRNKI